LSLARRTDRVFQLEHGKLTVRNEVLAETKAEAEQIAGAGAKTPGERVTRV
jgi:hypothetical protein